MTLKELIEILKAPDHTDGCKDLMNTEVAFYSDYGKEVDLLSVYFVEEDNKVCIDIA